METRLHLAGRTSTVALTDAPDGLRATVDGRPLALRLLAVHRVRAANGSDAAELVLIAGGVTYRAVAVRAGERVLVSLDGRPYSFALGESPRRGAASGGTGVAIAPMPGTIVRVAVAAGDAVTPGEVLVVLEAMKMELALRAEIAGTVTAVRVSAGDAVEAGAELVEIAPA